MKVINYSILFIGLFIPGSCKQKAPGPGTGNDNTGNTPGTNTPAKEAQALKFACPISNGMKGDSLFFDVSADRKTLSNLTFKGYWRCSDKLSAEPAAGPKGSFNIVNDKVDGVISEPPGGGSTSWRFELHAALSGSNASGTFRMNINNLGCDSYVLKFEGSGH